MTSQAISGTLSLATSGTFVIPVGGFFGWGFDVNLNSSLSASGASGNLYIQTQYTNPVGDTYISTLSGANAIASGSFAGGATRLTIDSNNVTTKGYVIVRWDGTDATSGSASIVGLVNIY